MDIEIQSQKRKSGRLMQVWWRGGGKRKESHFLCVISRKEDSEGTKIDQGHT